MKINIWIDNKKVEELNKFLQEGIDLPEDFIYFLQEPGPSKGIYVLSVQLTYDEYVRLKDH
tara:strand:- start:3684 stop:3866 length:183 start_codon:yes stop_codon:yes gene_type:complete